MRRVVQVLRAAVSGAREPVVAPPVVPPVLPSVLPAKLRAVYFKDGRVGIYTRDQRRAILEKFAGKRRRRVWTKKVRYGCRKNLAHQRVRVKGRFVKTTVPLKADMDAVKAMEGGSA